MLHNIYNNEDSEKIFIFNRKVNVAVDSVKIKVAIYEISPSIFT